MKTDLIRHTLDTLPDKPGVYLFKDPIGIILYIGKATSLKKRVASYFSPTKKEVDWKTTSLLQECDHIDYHITKNEPEAALLEAQLIGAYQPKFNILLKAGQPFLYLMFTHEELPRMHLTRNKSTEGTYFGPFLKKQAIRSLYNFLMSTFQLNLCNKKIPNGCLDYHIGTCPGTCTNKFDRNDYLFRIELVKDVLQSNPEAFKDHIKNQLNLYNKQYAFEKSKKLAEYLRNIDEIFATIRAALSLKKLSLSTLLTQEQKSTTTSDTYENTMQELQKLVGTQQPLYVIDCFDISHFQSTHLVGSCIRFVHGIPDTKSFRRFKIKSIVTQDDYAALKEIVTRRYATLNDLPDLVVIDGGKGQLNAVARLVHPSICISLAKREETIFSPQYPNGIKITPHAAVGKLLITLRDYTHHFAISYHRLKRHKNWIP